MPTRPVPGQPTVGRSPDFIIIGAMKCGTTSLFHWIGQHPDVHMPAQKEPSFFAREERWRLGLGWYESLFADVPDACLTGEASVIYTHPAFSPAAAHRISIGLPAVRLIFLVRDPIARIRSHYMHRIQKRDEGRTLGAALEDPDNEYVKRSLYYSCLAPYIDRFDASSVCVVRTEDLAGDDEAGWSKILSFLGLSPMSKPVVSYNAAADKVFLGRTAKWLSSTGFLSYSSSVPDPVRRLGKRMLTRGEGSAHLTGSAVAQVPPRAMEALRVDHRKLVDWLGREGPLWGSLES